jgi:hypothetical protein
MINNRILAINQISSECYQKNKNSKSNLLLFQNNILLFAQINIHQI